MATALRWRFLRLGVIAAAAVAAVAAPGLQAGASAQLASMKAMGQMQTPNLSSRQLRQYADVLGLSPEQRQSAEALLEGYELDYRAAVKRLEEIMRAVQEEAFSGGGDMSVWQQHGMSSFTKFRRRVASLEKGVLDDIKSLLEPAQLERWPNVERLHRRETTINFGSLSGESVDLIKAADSLKLDSSARASLAETLGQYEVDLDRQLADRNRVLEEQMEGMLAGMTGEDALTRMQEAAKKEREAGKRIVEVNERYFRQIESLLPEDAKPRWRAEYNQRAFPRIFRPSFADRVLSAAAGLDDLDDSQKQGLAALKESYAREAATLNDRWVAAVRESESSDDPMAMWMAFAAQQQGPIKDARDARTALDEKTVDSVRSLLNEAQKARLPDKKARPEFDFDAPSPTAQ